MGSLNWNLKGLQPWIKKTGESSGQDNCNDREARKQEEFWPDILEATETGFRGSVGAGDGHSTGGARWEAQELGCIEELGELNESQ